MPPPPPPTARATAAAGTTATAETGEGGVGRVSGTEGHGDYREDVRPGQVAVVSRKRSRREGRHRRTCLNNRGGLQDA